MADTYYAWSNFRQEVNEWGVVTKTLTPGEEVSQELLGVSDEEWQDIVDSGAARTDPYPDIADNVAPAEYYKDNPEEAPAIQVDASTPQPGAMAAIDAGLAAGQQFQETKDTEPKTVAEVNTGDTTSPDESGSSGSGDGGDGGTPPLGS